MVSSEPVFKLKRQSNSRSFVKSVSWIKGYLFILYKTKTFNLKNFIYSQEMYYKWDAGIGWIWVNVDRVN